MFLWMPLLSMKVKLLNLSGLKVHFSNFQFMFHSLLLRLIIRDFMRLLIIFRLENDLWFFRRLLLHCLRQLLPRIFIFFLSQTEYFVSSLAFLSFNFLKTRRFADLRCGSRCENCFFLLWRGMLWHFEQFRLTF